MDTPPHGASTLDRNQHPDFAMHIKVNELSEVVVSANRNGDSQHDGTLAGGGARQQHLLNAHAGVWPTD